MPSPPSGFEPLVLQHLDGAFNLARWLMRNDQDAQDAVQESCVKALRSFSAFRGGDFRAWFFTIVRNTCFTAINRSGQAAALDEHCDLAADDAVYDPQKIALRSADTARVRAAIDQLPVALRETIVLREIEGMSYKDIGKIIGVPIGTVMSRLARGRSRLQGLLSEPAEDLQ